MLNSGYNNGYAEEVIPDGTASVEFIGGVGNRLFSSLPEMLLFDIDEDGYSEIIGYNKQNAVFVLKVLKNQSFDNEYESMPWVWEQSNISQAVNGTPEERYFPARYFKLPAYGEGAITAVAAARVSLPFSSLSNSNNNTITSFPALFVGTKDSGRNNNIFIYNLITGQLYFRYYAEPAQAILPERQYIHDISITTFSSDKAEKPCFFMIYPLGNEIRIVNLSTMKTAASFTGSSTFTSVLPVNSSHFLTASSDCNLSLIAVSDSSVGGGNSGDFSLTKVWEESFVDLTNFTSSIPEEGVEIEICNLVKAKEDGNRSKVIFRLGKYGAGCYNLLSREVEWYREAAESSGYNLSNGTAGKLSYCGLADIAISDDTELVYLIDADGFLTGVYSSNNTTFLSMPINSVYQYDVLKGDTLRAAAVSNYGVYGGSKLHTETLIIAGSSGRFFEIEINLSDAKIKSDCCEVISYLTGGLYGLAAGPAAYNAGKTETNYKENVYIKSTDGSMYRMVYRNGTAVLSPIVQNINYSTNFSHKPHILSFDTDNENMLLVETEDHRLALYRLSNEGSVNPSSYYSISEFLFNTSPDFLQLSESISSSPLLAAGWGNGTVLLIKLPALEV
ncbi:MAG: hypothetical protein QW728_04660, partial [Thermoplasmata archaeon]